MTMTHAYQPLTNCTFQIMEQCVVRNPLSILAWEHGIISCKIYTLDVILGALNHHCVNWVWYVWYMILNSWTERWKCISVFAHQPRQQCISKLICTFPDDLCGIACTQARSQVAYLPQRIPALAGPCDGWQVWGCVWVLLPMWMCIIIIIIVITNIINIMHDSPFSSHWAVCLNSCIECIMSPALPWW